MTRIDVEFSVAEASDAPRHPLSTKLVHMALAAAVVTQLLTSLLLAAPSNGRSGDLFFELHEYSGLAALVFVLAFWLVAVLRHRGTPLVRLFPWLNPEGRRAFWQDLQLHLLALRRRRLPPFREDAPFAAAIHGLGLLLMTAMAASGALYWFAGGGDPEAGGLIFVAMLIHKALANLVWAYLIGHAGMAVVHHVTAHQPLGEMWSLQRGNGASGTGARE